MQDLLLGPKTDIWFEACRRAITWLALHVDQRRDVCVGDGIDGEDPEWPFAEEFAYV
jgi:hypothetical protein